MQKLVKNLKSHQEEIICPNCGSVEIATVEHSFPWWTYFHICSKCEYVIMESEWSRNKEVEQPKPKEDEFKYFPIRWLIKLILKYNSVDCFIWFNKIVKEPPGEAEKQPDDVLPRWLALFFPFVYIWQYRDGGYTGDDFAGAIYYRLFPFVWLEFGYEC